MHALTLVAYVKPESGAGACLGQTRISEANGPLEEQFQLLQENYNNCFCRDQQIHPQRLNKVKLIIFNLLDNYVSPPLMKLQGSIQVNKSNLDRSPSDESVQNAFTHSRQLPE